jgi:glucose-6-phosphate 1-dehydrogenase
MTPTVETAADAQADVLVVFGITGNLARVMTFRSLYRLQKRGLLTCPVVGVAVDDWTIDQLVQRARESIVATGEELNEDVFNQFVKQLSYVRGSVMRPPISASRTPSKVSITRCSIWRSRRRCLPR